MLVVAFDLRICLGAYFVFFFPSELLAKYLIRPLSVGLTKNVKPSNICWLVSPPQALFKFFFFLFFNNPSSKGERRVRQLRAAVAFDKGKCRKEI